MADVVLEKRVSGRQRKRSDLLERGPARAADPVRIGIGPQGHVLNEAVKLFKISVRKLVGHSKRLWRKTGLSWQIQTDRALRVMFLIG
jgi:hypothetical protein